MFVKFCNQGNLEYYALVDNLDDIHPDPTGFERVDFEVAYEDIQFLRKVNGQIIIDEQAKAVAQELANKNKRISDIKSRLTSLSEDIVQDQAGELVPDIAERMAEFVRLHNELRVLEGKEPREVKA